MSIFNRFIYLNNKKNLIVVLRVKGSNYRVKEALYKSNEAAII